MKLLLTSAGFTNPAIADALRTLTDHQFGKPFAELDLVFVTTALLAHSMRTHGMDTLFHEIIESKVYVGISAGSMVTSRNLALSTSAQMYSESVGPVSDDTGLGWVPFHFRPHLNSEWFPSVREPLIAQQAKQLREPIYALDDNCALSFRDGDVAVTGSGEWKFFEG